MRRSEAGRRQEGQVLLIFAGGLVAFLAMAALVFDVGQNLFDWRAQRDAADAAALAGARYVGVPAPGCGSIASCPDALDAALEVAQLNGYGDGVTNCPGAGSEQVCVSIPPIQGPFSGTRGFVEVDIHRDRPSFFAGVLGVLRQNVNALAVAGNTPGFAPPYSLLALNDDCDPNPSGQAGGNGSIDVGGSVVVNSGCDGALLANGNGSLVAPECQVSGTSQVAGGNATFDCDSLVEGADPAPDPLAGLPPPGVPAYPPANVQVLSWNGGGSAKIPAGCPGSRIEFVGAGFANGSSVSLPTPFNPYDVAVVFAYNANSDTAPTRPGGWTNIVSGTGADGNSRSIGYRVLRTGDTTTGTWTSATDIEVIVLAGNDPGNPIGANASGGDNTTTLTTPGMTLSRTDGTSWVVAFAASKGTNANTKDLSGTTTRSGSVGALALHTGERISSWSSRNYSSPVDAAGNRTDAVEIVAGPQPATAANPIGCTFTGGGGGKYNIFRIHPGVYYGGIAANGTVRVYMAPGTYWLAGGGLSIAGTGAQLISVDGPNSTTPGRGVLIYNTEDTGYCGVVAGACIDAINANGGSDAGCPLSPVQPSLDFPYTPNPPALKCAWVHLEPNDSPYKNLLIFVDRTLSADIFFNGSTGVIELEGTIYDPLGEVRINGSADDAIAAQVIANTFKITGNGDFTVTYDSEGIFQLKGVGLVQ